MPTTEQLIIEIKAQNKDLITKVNEVQGKLGQVEGKTADIGKNTAVSLAKMAGGWMAVKTAVKFVVNTLKESVAAAIEQNRVEAQLNATLKSTGSAAGLTSKELLKMASGLQSMTNYGDEAIIGAENILLTFTKIGRDVFPKALKSVLNMSTALGTDLKSSSTMIGKALNDPIQGISALTRSGVQFSEEQQKVIKTMAETGRVAEAQSMILKELEVQFGGSAEAAVKADGGMTQLKNTIGDLKEQFGFLLLNALAPLIPVLKKIVSFFIQLFPAQYDLKTTTQSLINLYSEYNEIVKKLSLNIDKMSKAERRALETRKNILALEILEDIEKLNKEYEKNYTVQKMITAQITGMQGANTTQLQFEKTQLSNFEKRVDWSNEYFNLMKKANIAIGQGNFATLLQIQNSKILTKEEKKTLESLQMNRTTFGEIAKTQEELTELNKDFIKQQILIQGLTSQEKETYKFIADYIESQKGDLTILNTLNDQLAAKVKKELDLRKEISETKPPETTKEGGSTQTVVPIFDTSEIEADIENWKKKRPKIELPIALGEIKRTKKDFGDLGKNLGKGLIDTLKGSDAKAGAQEFGNKIAGALQQMGGWAALIGTLIQMFWGKTSAAVKGFVMNLMSEINKNTLLLIETLIKMLFDPKFIFNILKSVFKMLFFDIPKLLIETIASMFTPEFWKNLFKESDAAEMNVKVIVTYDFEKYLRAAQESSDFDKIINRAKADLDRLIEARNKAWDKYIITRSEDDLKIVDELNESIKEQKDIIADLYRAEIDYNRKLLDMKQKRNVEGLTDIMLLEEQIKFINDILASQKEMGQYGLSAMEILDYEDELIDLEKEYAEALKDRQLTFDEELEHRKNIGKYEGREIDFINDMIHELTRQLNYLKSINDYGEDYEDIQERIYALQQQQTEEIQNQIDKEKELKMEKLDENQKLYTQLVRMYSRNEREAQGLLNMYDQFRFKQETGMYQPGGFDIAEAIRLSELGVNLLESNQMRDIMSLGIRDLFSAMQIAGSSTINNFDFGSFINNLNTQAADPDLLYQKFLSFIEIFSEERGAKI